MTKQKNTRIKPKYIKNASGKTIQVYLDIDSYESMIARMKKFDAIKKRQSSKTCRLSDHVPNKTTLKAIKDIEKGRNLVEVKNVKELLKKLGS